MEAFAFNVVLEVATTLERCVETDAEDTAAEEDKDDDPLHARPTGALALDLCKPQVAAVLARDLHWAAAGPFDFLR